MTYIIADDRCLGCGQCLPQCPTHAISIKDEQLWIDPQLCNYCEGYYPQPQCVISCPISLPAPAIAKKGRKKSIEADRPHTNLDLFPHGKKNHPFASAMVLWEACNLLAQGSSLDWQKDDKGKLVLSRPINQGKGQIRLWMSDRHHRDRPVALTATPARIKIESLDIRAACLHLIYAAQATTLKQPWEQTFTIGDRQIEQYLGLHKRKDLSKPAKLMLIKELVQQPCEILTEINWPTQGKVKGFHLEKSYLWHLIETQHHFQEEANGCKHLVGLTFTIQAGLWAKYFLNQQDCKEGKAFYQYGSLPQSVLNMVMSLWQQHEGAVRMMLWLLFKTRIGQQQRIIIATLMRIAYGQEKINKAEIDREERKRRLRTFESDLEILDRSGLKPIFDPDTYPADIQPLWAKLTDIPEDGEAALEFWMNDGSNENRLTDAAPRGKWTRLLHARLLGFELPADWAPVRIEREQKKPRTPKQQKLLTPTILSPEQIATARKNQGWSQRELAIKIGKSQSWVRDIENGRFRLKRAEHSLLRSILVDLGST